MNIGFIGLGNMGFPMMRRLVDAGHAVVVFDAHASRDKFPRAVLPRTFDYGFATGLMVKDVRLYLEEAHSLGLPTQVADAVAALWESTMDTQGPGSDFTSIVKPLEEAAGVVVDGRTP